ncbi:MAG: ATP-binding cassette domain-containing protein, partial [Stellaceae bacterium]
MTTAMRTEGLSRHFGTFRAVDNVSFRLEQGARQALIGPNGAGKTTFINVLTGSLPPSRGDIFLGDEKITRFAQHHRVKRGLTRTFQITTLFPGLTVLETVVLAICERTGQGGRFLRPVATRKAEIAEALALLRSLRLDREIN